MAATVKTVFSGQNLLTVNITGVWATSDATDSVVVDRSTLIGPDGVNPPNKIRIDEITWAISSGIEAILLEWDDGTDEVIEYLSGQGYYDYRPQGGKNMATDPGSVTEGDILLSELGGAAGEYYSIMLNCRLKN